MGGRSGRGRISEFMLVSFAFLANDSVWFLSAELVAAERLIDVALLLLSAEATNEGRKPSIVVFCCLAEVLGLLLPLQRHDHLFETELHSLDSGAP